MKTDYTATNRELWNRWTRLHAASPSEHYDLDRFKAGATTLHEIELAELGDVAGKSLLHLQCHFGLDTLSWAREGAIVTAVDLSEEAIAMARSLSQELNLRAEFICSDLFELPRVLDRQFDIVFTSYGVLPWLPDLDRWAEVVVHFLKPGGTFYMVEGHPIRRLLLPRRVDGAGRSIELGYFHSSEPIRVQERGSYAQPGADSIHTAYYWPHGLGEIVTALSGAGLHLEFLHEFPRMIKNCHVYEETKPGRFELRLVRNVQIPNLFSIRATL